MRNSILQSLNKIIIPALVILIIVIPTQAGSYNTFFNAYDFKLPHNDVKYNPTGATSASTTTISMPSMDIQEVKFHFNSSSFFFAEMIMGGKPYTNDSILYEFNLSFDINSTTKLTIIFNNAVNPSNYHYTSVNSSLANVAISTPNKLVQPFSYPIKPIIQNENITWIADLHEVSAIVPFSQIFTKTGFSNQSTLPYQNDFIFKFQVKNSAYTVYDTFEIDHIGNPSNYAFLIYAGIGVVLIAIAVYIYYKHKK